MSHEDEPIDAIDVDIPRLEPDFSSSPFATGPDIVPPTQPANMAPFLTAKSEPALGPEHAPFHPPAQTGPPPSANNYVDVPPVMAPADRWGIPVTDRPSGVILGTPRERAKAALGGAFAGFAMSIAMAVGIAAVLVYWSPAMLWLTLVSGVAIGWLVPIVWGRTGIAPAFLSGALSMLSVALTAWVADSWASARALGTDILTAAQSTLSEPVAFAVAYAERHIEVIWYLVAAVLIGAIQAGRRRRGIDAP